MTAPFLAWSHSRRKTFMACPKQLYHTAVLKKNHPEYAPYIESKAQKDGSEIDAALTARIASNAPLEGKFACYEPMVQAVLAAPGTKLTQAKLALDQAFKPVGYMDWDNAWVRSIYDLAIVNGDHAFLWDWKNGQIWPDDDQLKLFAAVGFHVFPEVDVIDTSLIWLKHGTTSDHRYLRKDLPEMWADLLPDVERMQVSFQTNHWPATPSKRACKFCQVNAAGKCPVAAVKYGD